MSVQRLKSLIEARNSGKSVMLSPTFKQSPRKLVLRLARFPKQYSWKVVPRSGMEPADEMDRDSFTRTSSLELKFGWLAQGPVS